MGKYGLDSGMRPGRPAKGKSGPGDGGKTDGTRHYGPPKPKGGRSGVQTGTKK